jgi:ribonuclease E
VTDQTTTTPETSPDQASAPRARRRSAGRAPGPPELPVSAGPTGEPAGPGPDEEPVKPVRRRRASATAVEPDPGATAVEPDPGGQLFTAPPAPPQAPPAPGRSRRRPAVAMTFVAPEAVPAEAERIRDDDPAWAALPADGDGGTAAAPPVTTTESPAQLTPSPAALDEEDLELDDDDDGTGPRRRRRRGRRGRGRGRTDEQGEQLAQEDAEAATGPDAAADPTAADTAGPDGDQPASSSSRRRRRRRGGAGGGADATDDPPNTVVRVREPRPRRERATITVGADDVRGVSGSTRLEAKRQRRRDGRDTGRRRAPIITEAEFLARREAVERVMLVRHGTERTQIAVLEDSILVEHYVTRTSESSFVNNVYLGKVQNVLPSMEAAFIDIGKGRNAVLYAGEVNYDASSLEGRPRTIEQALKNGQPTLVQVTKDPIGHKGARLTSQVSLPGRYLVYVPEGSMTGISRKLPDTERARLKAILKKVVPDNAGVIIRTAAEGASEEELTSDVNRLEAQWQDIKAKAAKASAPALVYAEPDLAIRVVRDVFNEDFASVVVSGEQEWEPIAQYVSFVAPDLVPRLVRWSEERDVFAAYRVDEQLARALDRKVSLPSGGSLVIDRAEAMTVVDVNTGRFTGKGGNLEETVTKNNLEAAEEIVRQLRLRDIGGIIVIDFIDMVLESNRELVLRRLTECLGRDRTKHQVAEVTSLGLVQMTRKRVGSGLLEAFSEPCEVCHGRGVLVHLDPVPAPVEGGPPPPVPHHPIPAPPPGRSAVPAPMPPEPVADAPAPAEPGPDEPVADQLVPDEPVADQPVAEAPAPAEPAAEVAPPAPRRRRRATLPAATSAEPEATTAEPEAAGPIG